MERCGPDLRQVCTALCTSSRRSLIPGEERRGAAAQTSQGGPRPVWDQSSSTRSANVLCRLSRSANCTRNPLSRTTMRPR